MVWIDLTSGMIVFEELPSIVGFEISDVVKLVQSLNCKREEDEISRSESKKHHVSNPLSSHKGEQAVSSDMEDGVITDDDEEEPLHSCSKKENAELYSLLSSNNEHDGKMVDHSWSSEYEEGEILDSVSSCERDESEMSNLFSSHKSGKVVSFELEDGEILDY